MSARTRTLESHQGGANSVSTTGLNSDWVTYFDEPVNVGAGGEITLQQLFVSEPGAGNEQQVVLDRDWPVEMQIAFFVCSFGGLNAPNDFVVNNNIGNVYWPAIFYGRLKKISTGAISTKIISGTIPAGSYSRQELVDALNAIFSPPTYDTDWYTRNNGGTFPTVDGAEPPTAYTAIGSDHEVEIMNISAGLPGGPTTYSPGQLGTITWAPTRRVVAGASAPPWTYNQEADKIVLSYTFTPLQDQNGNPSVYWTNEYSLTPGSPGAPLTPMAIYTVTGWTPISWGENSANAESWEQTVWNQLGFSFEQCYDGKGAVAAPPPFPNSLSLGFTDSIAIYQSVCRPPSSYASYYAAFGGKGLPGDLLAPTSDVSSYVQALEPLGFTATTQPQFGVVPEDCAYYIVELQANLHFAGSSTWVGSTGQQFSKRIGVASRNYKEAGYVYSFENPIPLQITGPGAISSIRTRLLYPGSLDGQPVPNSVIGAGSSALYSLTTVEPPEQQQQEPASKKLPSK